jgi:hypothetical protein
LAGDSFKYATQAFNLNFPLSWVSLIEVQWKDFLLQTHQTNCPCSSLHAHHPVSERGLANLHADTPLVVLKYRPSEIIDLEESDNDSLLENAKKDAGPAPTLGGIQVGQTALSKLIHSCDEFQKATQRKPVSSILI